MAKEQTDPQKETFEVGMSDELLLGQIDEWYKESESFYAQIKRVWETNILYYKGQQTGVEMIFGKNSKAVENRIFMATETMVPIVTTRLPDMVVRSGDTDEQSQKDALDLQDILSYHFERMGIQEKTEQFARDTILKRYGVFKVLWDKENDDVGLAVIDPRRVRVPRYGKTVNDLKFVIEELEMGYDQAVLQFGALVASELLRSGKKESDIKVRKHTFSVLEVWTNENVVWKSGNAILKKQKNPYYDFKDLSKNFFSQPKKPYVIKSLFHTEESIIGDTDYVQQLLRVQDNINTRKRQIEDIANKVANPILLVDSSTGLSEEEISNISNEPGLIIYGSDVINKIKFETPGQLPGYLFDDVNTSRNEFDNIWGIHSTTRGEREGRETLGGRQILREADLGRIDLLGRQVERAMDEIAEYWVQLIKLFYTEEKTFSILGEDGIRFVKNFSGDKIGNVIPSVRPGSTLKEDEATIKQNAIILWQNKAIGIRTLYKMLRIPNMQEAIDDFIETQSGQLLRQGQVGGAVPPQVSEAVVPPPEATAVPPTI